MTKQSTRLLVTGLLALLPLPRTGGAVTRDSRPWWHDYQTLVSYSMRKLGHEWELGMMAERGGWATGWYGAWWIAYQAEDDPRQRVRRRIEHFRKQGVKDVFYFDAGEFGEFVALVHQGRLVRNQWDLRFYQGEPGQLMWFGKDGFYRDKNPLRLPNYGDFGLPAWTLPNGARVPCVYDLARMSLAGRRDAWDYSAMRCPPEVARKLDLNAFLRRGRDPVPAAAHGSLGRICSYDHSSPFLLDDFKAGLRIMLALKPAFLHFDNYFDNETLYPATQAFGPWSVENFRRFLTAKLTPGERHELGIDEVDQFDLQRYIHDKPYRSRGQRWHLHNTRWHDDRIWNLFVCSKVADSDRLFRRLYAFCKAESGRRGREVVVAGNTNPLFPGRSLVTGAMDIAHFEHHAATQFGPIVVPTGLPPLGRLGGVVRLGAAVSAAGYCWPSVYVPKQLGGPGHENLHKVMAMDCLANKGVLDYNYQYRNGYSPGSDVSAAWADCFIKSFSSYYGRRTALADVGLVFPGQSVLASVSVFTMEPKTCLYDYLGWAQALTDLHVQWDVVPDDQLRHARIAPFKLLVLPSAACLSDESIAALRAYVDGGGQVVISGEAGTRYGRQRFLWHRQSGSTLAAQLSSLDHSGHRVPSDQTGRYVRCPDAPGMTYYLDVADGVRADGRTAIQQAVAKGLRGARKLLETNVPTTVGLFAFQEPRGAMAVDVVNYNIDPGTDRVTPARDVQLTLYPPPGKHFSPPRATLISPDRRGAADKTAKTTPLTPWRYPRSPVAGRLREDGAMELILPEVAVFATISVPVE